MRRLVTILWIPLLLTAGCSDTRPLLDERTAEPYASWSRVRGHGYGRTAHFVEAQPPGAASLRMHLVHLRSAAPQDERLLVLQPGVLADHRTWRFLAPLLAERNDVLLVDPPGTGRSDAPDPAQHPAPVYTPAWIGAHTLRAVRRWQQRRGDARRLVLVGHSLGSAVLVRALTEPQPSEEITAVARSIDGLVLLACPDVLMPEDPETLRRVADLGDLEVRAGAALGLLDAEMDRVTQNAVVNPLRRALRQESQRLGNMLRSDRTRHPAQAMLKRFVPLGPDLRPVPAAARAIADRERGLAHPVLLIWGVQDNTLPFSSAARVAARLPRVERVDVPDAKHSPHQARADVVAWAIAGFLSRHPTLGSY